VTIASGAFGAIQRIVDALHQRAGGFGAIPRTKAAEHVWPIGVA
jgi:hypothetical protein